VKKTKTMIISKTGSMQCSISVHGTTLQQVSQLKEVPLIAGQHMM